MEVLIAMLIVGFIFTTIYIGINQSFVVTRATQENLRAIQILQDKTETIRLYTWSQINSNGFIPATFTNSFNPLSTNGGIMFNGTMSIANSGFSESYAGDVKLVTVTVNWTSAGIGYQQQMKTLVSHYGLQNYIYSH